MISSKKTGQYDQPGTLMQRTLALIKDRDLLQVYSDTKISFYWLQKFSASAFKNPSVNRVQYLFEYLTNKPLL